ncbi:Outer envelope pore protein 16-3 [Nymphaea thermarum]|nr:Outer envelope pore protein 16-3 [Nymphaea thermarum]
MDGPRSWPTSGVIVGTVWGTIVATWYDVPRVERSVVLPGLVRTAKLIWNYGLTFAAISDIYIGVDQMVEKNRMKKDFINSAVGGFVVGAFVLGFKVHSKNNKMQEFLELQQNHMSLEEYVIKYWHLGVYCPHLYATDEVRADEFVHGLRDGLRSKVMSSRPCDLDEAVTIARRMEEDWVHQARRVDLEQHHLKLQALWVLADRGQQVDHMALLTSYWTHNVEVLCRTEGSLLPTQNPTCRLGNLWNLWASFSGIT